MCGLICHDKNCLNRLGKISGVPPAYLAVRIYAIPPATSHNSRRDIGGKKSTLSAIKVQLWSLVTLANTYRSGTQGFLKWTVPRFSTVFLPQKSRELHVISCLYKLFYPIVSWILMCGLFCISPVLHPTYEHKKWTLLWQFSHSSAIDPGFVILLDDPDITSLVSIICLIHIFVNTLRKGTWKGFHDATQASEDCDEVATTSSQSSLHTLQTNDTLPKTNIFAPKNAGFQ